ncbi:sigma factor-like helix-turn-helix DNA-binding protein [Hephaestia mangrovi]|uniref:sigma factor-like helix-turn-helix DNA-binding protein n=1 Tax=Hephaestia mangrovi TaxID=2873268 RepID=UPI001CA68FE0|nr:hypothetical protein [Hephaestia mangrovi]
MSGWAGNARVRRRLVTALAQLPEHQRVIYVALARDGLTYDVLAERLGVGVDEIERDFAAALATRRRDRQASDAVAVPAVSLDHVERVKMTVTASPALPARLFAALSCR